MQEPVKRRSSPIIIAAVLLGAMAAIVVVTDPLAERDAVRRKTARTKSSAGLLASGFRRDLEKFSLAGVGLAQDPDVGGALTANDPARTRALDRKFERFNGAMGASAIYLMDTRGTTIAASNYRVPTSFVGTNCAFRSYFREAVRGGHFEQYALRSVSRRPGLDIARLIARAGQALGVAVIEVGFDAIEAGWAQSGSIAFATDADGVILLRRPSAEFSPISIWATARCASTGSSRKARWRKPDRRSRTTTSSSR